MTTLPGPDVYINGRPLYLFTTETLVTRGSPDGGLEICIRTKDTLNEVWVNAALGKVVKDGCPSYVLTQSALQKLGLQGFNDDSQDDEGILATINGIPITVGGTWDDLETDEFEDTGVHVCRLYAYSGTIIEFYADEDEQAEDDGIIHLLVTKEDHDMILAEYGKPAKARAKKGKQDVVEVTKKPAQMPLLPPAPERPEIKREPVVFNYQITKAEFLARLGEKG